MKLVALMILAAAFEASHADPQLCVDGHVAHHMCMGPRVYDEFAAAIDVCNGEKSLAFVFDAFPLTDEEIQSLQPEANGDAEQDRSDEEEPEHLHVEEMDKMRFIEGATGQKLCFLNRMGLLQMGAGEIAVDYDGLFNMFRATRLGGNMTAESVRELVDECKADAADADPMDFFDDMTLPEEDLEGDDEEEDRQLSPKETRMLEQEAAQAARQAERDAAKAARIAQNEAAKAARIAENEAAKAARIAEREIERAANEAEREAARQAAQAARKAEREVAQAAREAEIEAAKAAKKAELEAAKAEREAAKAARFAELEDAKAEREAARAAKEAEMEAAKAEREAAKAARVAEMEAAKAMRLAQKEAEREKRRQNRQKKHVIAVPVGEGEEELMDMDDAFDELDEEKQTLVTQITRAIRGFDCLKAKFDGICRTKVQAMLDNMAYKAMGQPKIDL